MGYYLLNGQWRKKISGQIVETSSSEDEEEDEEQPREFTTIAASAQKEEIENQELIDITIEPPTIDKLAPSAMDTPTPPTMDIPTSDTTQTSIIEPSVSQSYIDNQMRQMMESITTSIGSMFEKFNQSVEQRFQKLSEEISQPKSWMDLYDLMATTAQDPSTSINSNLTYEIREVLQQGIDGISSEVKARSSRISKLKDCRRFEDEYSSNLRILRAKFGRVRGSADNFAKLQADTLKGLRDDTKQITSEMKLVWHFICNLQIPMDKLIISIKVKIKPPDPSDYP